MAPRPERQIEADMLVIAFVLMAVAFTVLAILIAGESAGGTPPLRRLAPQGIMETAHRCK